MLIEYQSWVSFVFHLDHCSPLDAEGAKSKVLEEDTCFGQFIFDSWMSLKWYVTILPCISLINTEIWICLHMFIGCKYLLSCKKKKKKSVGGRTLELGFFLDLNSSLQWLFSSSFWQVVIILTSLAQFYHMNISCGHMHILDTCTSSHLTFKPDHPSSETDIHREGVWGLPWWSSD